MGATTLDTIVDSWKTPSRVADITKTGRRALSSDAQHFYLYSAGPPGPEGWSKCWHDIDEGVPASEKHLLLGGEMSMWTDHYCYVSACGADNGSLPGAHQLFKPAHDAEFGRSVGGMLWPRGYVAAASFWGYDSTANASGDEFAAAIWRLNDQLAARGSWVCPTNCSCDELTACGKPYLSNKTR